MARQYELLRQNEKTVLPCFISHCLLSSHSNRGKPEMALTCCAAITCSQHLVT